MAVHISFKTHGFDEAHRVLLGYADRGQDMTPAWEAIKVRFLAYEEDWFASEGDGHWPPLSPTYAAWKATHFPGEPILVATGHLRSTLTSGPDIDVIEPDYFVFGTGDPVAAYHQFGMGYNPQRRVIDVDNTEITEWTRIVQAHLAGEDVRP